MGTRSVIGTSTLHYFFFMDVVPNERVVEVAGNTFFTCENLQPSKVGVSYRNRTKESFTKLNYVLLWEERFGVRVHQTRGDFAQTTAWDHREERF